MFRDDRVEREEESLVVSVVVDSAEFDKVDGLDDETVLVVGGIFEYICLLVAVVLVTRVSHMVPAGKDLAITRVFFDIKFHMR